MSGENEKEGAVPSENDEKAKKRKKRPEPQKPDKDIETEIPRGKDPSMPRRKIR